MFKNLWRKIRKYIRTVLMNAELKQLIREKAAVQEEFDSYAHDAGVAMDILCEDKKALQERCKKLEQECAFYNSDRDAIAKRYEKYIHKLKVDFEKRESELMHMVGVAEANCRLAEARHKALDVTLRDYIAKLERSEDDLK